MSVSLLLFTTLLGLPMAEGASPPVRVSENGRFLLQRDGSPFFYLGDTAWELFHRLNREEATTYLADRASKGFTVIQAVAIAELDGHSDPNPYGHLPLVNLDPAHPATKEGPNNDYWDHVDFIVDQANQKGLTIGFLPTWGRYWHDKIKDGQPIFNPRNAEIYGEWLGKRYKDKALIWVLGGDRSIDNDTQRDLIRAMAAGIKRGDGGSHLITFHPPGGVGSSKWFHDEKWLDFNMRQNGHVLEYNERYENTLADYRRSPTKPVIDAEPIYEDHPVAFNARKFGHSTSADTRRPLYWDLFNGACGHTYGHHSVWQMWQPGRNPVNAPLLSWREAINQPGAAQMQHARRLIESRPILTRVPDDSIIVTDRVPTAVPGSGIYRFAATRDEAGTYAMIYAPVGRTFSVKLDTITGDKINAWWFNPRTGKADSIGSFAAKGIRSFLSPNPGEELDWVLVLDSATAGYGPPGQLR